MFIEFVGTMEENEKAVKILDKMSRRFFGIYGIKRTHSLFDRFGFGLHEIKIKMPGFMYNLIREHFIRELVKVSGKEIVKASEKIEENEKSIVLVFVEQTRKQEKRAEKLAFFIA